MFPVVASIAFLKVVRRLHTHYLLASATTGGISMFTFSGGDEDSDPVTMETSMVEVDFGGKYLGVSGAIMVAAFLPKCT
jgi:hypothetical protein